MTEWLGLGLLGFGIFFVAVAAVGLFRLPDVFCRSHALGKAFTLGINAMLAGLWLVLGAGSFGLKVLLVVFFLFLTIPVATHLLNRLAWQAQQRRSAARK